LLLFLFLGTLTIKDATELKFPASFVETEVQRVDALGEDCKRLIKVCSCFGLEFREKDLLAVAPRFLTRPSQISKVLAELRMCSKVCD